ncbi:MAG TPA: helix-turn-helix domain-containing protein [Steroidobacteraceae bacterium]|nr:helix-turn-helix domain-containing protein [Steroidobacteraceae bacterium]
MSDTAQIDDHAGRIRASEVLGRSDQLRRLFDYLVECSRTGKVPKESVIAVEVFGRGTDFDVSQDAAVRVYIHKLRRKFEEFYAEHPEIGPERLTIPKGEYRLVLEHPPSEATAVEVVPPAPRVRNPWKIATFAALTLLLAVGAVAALLWQHRESNHIAQLSANPVWSRLIQDTRPITVVLGDYYIFAETDALSQPQRLVREFSINSRSDLDQYLMEHPQMADKYMDAQLSYLPTSSAYVMADIMPLLASTHRPIRIRMMSELEPDALKSTDVVYVGYLSGLGMLADPTFSGSRFSVGSSYDELLDDKTHARYVSQAGDRYARPQDESGPLTYREYSLIAGFEGPSGNQMLIIAGMRDVGLMQAGEALTGINSLRQLSQHLPNGPFEALYEVTGMNTTNVASKLLVTSARKPVGVWSFSETTTAAKDR